MKKLEEKKGKNLLMKLLLPKDMTGVREAKAERLTYTTREIFLEENQNLEKNITTVTNLATRKVNVESGKREQNEGQVDEHSNTVADEGNIGVFSTKHLLVLFVKIVIGLLKISHGVHQIY